MTPMQTARVLRAVSFTADRNSKLLRNVDRTAIGYFDIALTIISELADVATTTCERIATEGNDIP